MQRLRLACAFFLFAAPVWGQALTELAVPADIAPLLRATLAVEKPSFRGSAPATVRFTLENVGQGELSVLTWHTPLEGVWADIFAVERNGKPVAYRGPLATRSVPSSEEYVRLAPGKTASAVVDLAKFYDLEKPGHYRVRLRATIFDLGSAAPDALAASLAREPRLSSRPLSSNEVSFEQVGVRPRRHTPRKPRRPARVSGDGTPTFERCSADQEDILFWALGKARVAASIATIGLFFIPEALRPASARTNKWFGTYDKGRFEKVRDNFQAIATQMRQSIDFDCGTCPSPFSSVVAWVYPGLPYGIYICGRYFTQPDEGAGSKVGTLVHEMSHFTVVAGTDDLAIGPAADEALAKRDPSAAVRNADNYESFAENDPYVPLRPDERLAALAASPPPRL